MRDLSDGLRASFPFCALSASRHVSKPIDYRSAIGLLATDSAIISVTHVVISRSLDDVSLFYLFATQLGNL